MPPSTRNFVAEFVGTFTLVFIGGGAIMMAGESNHASLLTVALAHGIALGVMVAATIPVSGGQLNPSITIGLMATRRLAPTLGSIHLVAQVLGAVVAAYLLKTAFPAAVVEATRIGGQAVASDTTTGHAILLEAIATFFLMFVVYGTAVTGKAPGVAGLLVGLTVSGGILAIGPLTGGSMNPARSFGPAMVSGVWEGQMIYWIGPIVGAVLAAVIWEYVIVDKTARTS
ncbi:MAG: Aquaporin Z 2 [Gemmatimonadaceae bacterium]|nr:Aquaporin Z 2 [Gemmatimonadaceae bacterium]